MGITVFPPLLVLLSPYHTLLQDTIDIALTLLTTTSEEYLDIY